MMRWMAAASAAVLLAVAAPASADETSAVELTVRDAWARATPPGAGVAAAYLTIVGGTAPDRLLGARSSVAAMTQVHAVTEEGGMTRMREAAGVDVPARGSVVLAPHGLHLMLMHLEHALVAGQRFVITLQFAHAGTREVSVNVLAPDEAPPSARQ